MDNDYEANRGYDDEPRYERERSASPRPAKRDDGYRGGRDRSASPNGRLNSRPPPTQQPIDDDEVARNQGTNLFVTGLSSTLSEDDVQRMFGKYGEVKSAAIMRDPHSGDSRGFGFVEMMTPEQADAAREALQGEQVGNRTLSIERARRSRPRTPTPGRYFGPPKREDRLGGGGGGRRGGFGGGYGRDDFYRGGGGGGGGGGYDDRRGYGGGRRDDYGRGPVDRYASSRSDRYGGGGRDDRYGGGGRDDRYGGGRDDRRDDRRGGGGGGGGDGYYGRDAPRSWEGGADDRA